jgi:hypothetical protein
MPATISDSAKVTQGERILSNCKIVYGAHLEFDIGSETHGWDYYTTMSEKTTVIASAGSL